MSSSHISKGLINYALARCHIVQALTIYTNYYTVSTMLNKLKKIAAKPYLKALKMSDVKRIIDVNHLPVEVKIVDGQEKIFFNPKAKAREKYTLLRLINDDYLESLMTGIDYEVTGKREV
jgi:hypothetical protein